EGGGPMGAHVVIINKTGRYQLQPMMKTAIRFDLAKPAAHKGALFSPMDPSVHFDPRSQLVHAEQVGTGSICGIECIIWRGEPPTGRPSSAVIPTQRHVMQAWMAKSGKPAFPLKVEVSGVGPNGADVTQTVTTIKFLDRIPAALFAVPKGYRI